MNQKTKSISSSALQSLLSNIDKIKIKKSPLADHYINELSSTEKELYFSHLLLLLKLGDSIGAKQQRLLQLLLPSAGLESSRLAELMLQAEHIKQQELEDLLALLVEKSLCSSFVIDALVLCRLEQPLNDVQSQILAELVKLLNIADADVQQFSQVAALILGLPQGELLPSNFNPDHLHIEHWAEFLTRELTAEHLKAGADNSYWIISKQLNINFGFSLHNAVIDFIDTGNLNINTNEKLQLSDNSFYNPVIKITGTGSAPNNIDIIDCHFEGDYPLSIKTTALQIENINANIKKSSFETNNARALRIISGKTSIKNCSFKGCGHPEMVGGAIASLTEDLNIFQSSFFDCKASIAGGIRCKNIVIKNSSFSECFSTSFPIENFNLEVDKERKIYSNNAGGIFSDHLNTNGILYCHFRLASIKATTDSSSYSGAVVDCQLTDSAVSMPSLFGIRNCNTSTTSHNPTIAKVTGEEIEYQSWWDDF